MLTPAECGRRCRVSFGELFKPQWGSYRCGGRGSSKMLFESNTVFALYSDFHADQSQWWYGVPKSEWEDWQNQSLAILMKESSEVYYVLLNPKETVTLLSRCGQDSKGTKKITIRRPTSGGRIYFVEWQEFPLPSRLCSLQVPWV